MQDSLDDHKRVLDHFWRWQSHHQPLLSSLAIATKPKEAREHSGSSWEAHSLKIAFLGKPQEKKNALQSSRDGSILPTPGADFGVLTSTCTAEHGESQPHSSLRAAAPFLLRAAAWAQKHGFSSRNGETFQQPSQLLSRCQTNATSLDAHNTDGSATEQKPQRRSKPYMNYMYMTRFLLTEPKKKIEVSNSPIDIPAVPSADSVATQLIFPNWPLFPSPILKKKKKE